MTTGAAPVGKRPYHTFLSHAHVDKTLVDKVYSWLADAKIPAWYDSINLPAGTRIANHLPKAIENSRSMIIVVSHTSVTKGWVEHEYDMAINHQTLYPAFRIIPLRIDDTDPPGFLANYKHINLSGQELTIEVAQELLIGLYGESSDIGSTEGRNVFVSRGWHTADRPVADVACLMLAESGLRLIGDCEDQPHWDSIRITAIIDSCGAFVAILPYRANSTHHTTAYALRELELASSVGLPTLVIAQPGVEVPTKFLGSNSPVQVCSGDLDEADRVKLRSTAEQLGEEWRPPRNPSYVFYATGIDGSRTVRNDAVRHVIETITGLPCYIGQEIRGGGSVQQAIVDYIRDASVVLADITDDNVNTCIEAGMARACKRPLYLLRRGEAGRPPFMFRDQQVFHFMTDAQLLARVHSLVYGYRRRLINRELAGLSGTTS
jgi:hypothetical protein